MIQLTPQIESVFKNVKPDGDCMSVSHAIRPIILEITSKLNSGDDLGAVELYAQLILPNISLKTGIGNILMTIILPITIVLISIVVFV